MDGKRCTLILTCALLLPAASPAQESGAGVGGMVGNSLGISWKLWRPHGAQESSPFAVAGGATWSLEGDNSALIHADYVVHGQDVLQRLAFFRRGGGDGRFFLYYGAGLRLQLFEHNRLGVRVPVGIEYTAGSLPVDAFLEIVPVLDLAAGTRLRLNAALGLRFFPPGPPPPGRRQQIREARPADSDHPPEAVPPEEEDSRDP